ncbi:PIG-P protein [Cardiosporidium cionae]|uniref:PIG-P protein n=1 Tax=Cardiosporidium cionae TaxID=476202 RepID=A0ABQ7JC81_9APIC|nr:PIG-P protein [Cardiosporidium cionae]|eukprot:KAF8821581.1 PIG-P protein [Cardiosporidium cionae]
MAIRMHALASWVVSWAAFALYCCLAFIPASALTCIGLTFESFRYWIMAVPIVCLNLLVMKFLIFHAFNLCYTPNLSSFDLVRDTLSRNEPSDQEKFDCIQAGGIPFIYDIPLWKVNAFCFKH